MSILRAPVANSSFRNWVKRKKKKKERKKLSIRDSSATACDCMIQNTVFLKGGAC